MLPDELADLKAKLIDHMKSADVRTFGKNRPSHQFYTAEADFILKLLKVDRQPKLEFPLLFLDFESTGLLDSAKPIQVAGVVVGKDLSKLDIVPSFQPAYIDCLDDRDAMAPEYWLAQNVHHKTMRQVIKEGRSPADIVAEFDAVHRKYPSLLLAGQNVGFDKRMLDKLYGMAGKRSPFDYHCLDLTALSIVHLGKKSLKETMAAVGLDESRYTHHDALGDAMATADAFIALMRRL